MRLLRSPAATRTVRRPWNDAGRCSDVNPFLDTNVARKGGRRRVGVCCRIVTELNTAGAEVIRMKTHDFRDEREGVVRAAAELEVQLRAGDCGRRVRRGLADEVHVHVDPAVLDLEEQVLARRLPGREGR
jgi:hypothetical protein